MTMTIGELSRRTGVPIKALRDYADAGMIYTLGRSPANYRLFDADALWCVRQIRELRALGLTLAEIAQLSSEDCAGPSMADLLRGSRERVRSRIAQQQAILHRIDQFEADHHGELVTDGTCSLDSHPAGRP